MRTSTGGPSAGIGSGSVSEWRWVRLSTPVATSDETPSGDTSDRRTTQVATGIVDPSHSTASGGPMIDTGSPSGSVVYVSPRSSSGRRSRARPLGCQPAPHDRAPEVPTVARWTSGSIPDEGRSSSTPRARPRSRPTPAPASRSRNRSSGAVPGTGTPAAARQRPGHCPGKGSGAAHSCSNHVSAGSCSHPFSTPLRYRSKKRAISWSQSRLGPG